MRARRIAASIPGPSNTQFLANVPTDALYVQPAAVKFILTFHE